MSPGDACPCGGFWQEGAYVHADRCRRWRPPPGLAPDALLRLAEAERRRALEWPDPDRITRQRLSAIRKREVERGAPLPVGVRLPGGSHNEKPITLDGVTYPSSAAAGVALGISPGAAWNRAHRARLAKKSDAS